MTRVIAIFVSAYVLVAAFPAWAESPRPNIVLILADDLGFSDVAPYGSEIATPTITALAEEGVRFTNYHTAASCAPSRAMLLTGVDSHRAGVPNIPEMLPPEHLEQSGNQGTLGHNVVTVATLLQDSGYRTYVAGKWHLGMTPNLLPSRRGFERTFVLADSGADNWEQKPYLPIYDKANWFADGEETELPENFYSSRFIVDKTIEFIDSHADDDRPFFAYLPFQAVHLPVQAPQEFIDRYMGVYDEGWDRLRYERRQRAVELGIVPEDAGMVAMPTTEDWFALSSEQKRYQAKRMAVYAGMVEAMDFNIGRLVEHLREIGEYENTIFIFTSDNGSEAAGPEEPESPLTRFGLGSQGYSTDYETLGLKGSFNSIGSSFASAAASPLAYYKFYLGEGGLRVPLILSGVPLQNDKRVGRIESAFTWVTDIAPTILELTGAAPAGERYGGRVVEPMIGHSLVPFIEGRVDRVYAEKDAVGTELAGHAALFQGDYKIVRNRGPVGDGEWRLYNITLDPGETTDLARTQPAQLQRMLSQYQEYATRNGVLAVRPEYDPQRQVAINGLRNRARTGILIGLLLGLTLLSFFFFSRAFSAR
ncbi:MAG: arylsulfatase [Deltaproteobacteria bacterium]|nr:arylsulfatase [Deltaproteobacteria bacterium]